MSALSLGSGGPNLFGLRGSSRSEAEIHAFVREALDLGINLFDTAPGYGSGRSEELLGRALQGVPRDSYVLSTKARMVDKDRTGIPAPAELRESVEGSLLRLGVDHVDILLLAGTLDGGCYERISETLVPEARRLQAEGKIRFIGASESSSSDGGHRWLARILKDDLADAVMVAYGLLNHSAEKAVFEPCLRQDVGTMIIYAVRRVFSQPERLREVVADLVERELITGDAVPAEAPLDWLLENAGDSLVRLGYRFSSAHPAVSTVLTGTTNPDHLRANLAAIESPPVPTEKLDRLRRTFGHLQEPIGN